MDIYTSFLGGDWGCGDAGLFFVAEDEGEFGVGCELYISDQSVWAARFQVYFCFWMRPCSINWLRLALSVANRCMASAISWIDSGLTNIAALPATSGMDEILEAITGTSQCMASRIGTPKPSNSEMYAKAWAAAVRLGRSSSGI